MTLPDSVRAQLAYRDSAVNNKCTCVCATHSTHTDQPPLLYLVSDISYIRRWIVLQGMAQRIKKEEHASEPPTSQHNS